MSKTFDVILVTDTPEYGQEKKRGYGAHRLASHLRLHGYSVLVLDFCSSLNFDLWSEICDLAIGPNTRMVGFSTTWWPYRDLITGSVRENTEEFGSISVHTEFHTLDLKPGDFTYHILNGTADKFIRLIKEKNKKIKIIIGGPRIDWYKDFPADHFVVGFGENQLVDLLENPRKIWPKIVEHDTNSMNREWGWTTSTTIYTDLDFLMPKEMSVLEISRGCRFHCAYCSWPLLGQKDVSKLYKTEETLYRELMTNYEKYGMYQYDIADDTYNDSIEKLELMYRVVNRLPFKPKFHAYIRLDLMAVHPEQIDLMLEGGLVNVYIGLETFHHNASKIVGKGMGEDRKKDTLRLINKKWGDSVCVDAGYIVGLPTEPLEFTQKQVDWFKSSDNPINHHISFYALHITPSWSLRFNTPSKIDLDPEKYGYHIPDRNKPNYWTKDDGTGITNYAQAATLAEQWVQEVANSPDRTSFHKTNPFDVHWMEPMRDYFLPLVRKLKDL